MSRDPELRVIARRSRRTVVKGKINSPSVPPSRQPEGPRLPNRCERFCPESPASLSLRTQGGIIDRSTGVVRCIRGAVRRPAEISVKKGGARCCRPLAIEWRFFAIRVLQYRTATGTAGTSERHVSKVLDVGAAIRDIRAAAGLDIRQHVPSAGPPVVVHHVGAGALCSGWSPSSIFFFLLQRTR